MLECHLSDGQRHFQSLGGLVEIGYAFSEDSAQVVDQKKVLHVHFSLDSR